MDKRFVYILLFCGFVAGLGLYLGFREKPERPAGQADMGEQALHPDRHQPWRRLDSVLMAEVALGVEEYPKGSNRGKRVEYYQKTAGIPKGSPWCAAFSYTCHELAGIPAYKSGWCPDWAVNCDIVYKKRKYFREVRPGDFILVYNSKKRRFDHITNIHLLDDDYYITIGGNESNGVRMNRTHKDQVVFIGSYTDRVL